MIRKSQAAEIAALAVFAVSLAAGALFLGFLKSALAAFAIAAFSYCALISLALQRAAGGDLPQLAAKHDRRAAVILVTGLAIDFSALLLVVLFLTTRSMDVIAIALAAASILAAWVLLNLLFAIHYAHTYFSGASRDEPPLVFPGAKGRVFSDFLYFSFVIGMTFQVSDVVIVDAGLRRLALAHAIIAFFFNVFVLALAVNAWGGLM